MTSRCKALHAPFIPVKRLVLGKIKNKRYVTYVLSVFLVSYLSSGVRQTLWFFYKLIDEYFFGCSHDYHLISMAGMLWHFTYRKISTILACFLVWIFARKFKSKPTRTPNCQTKTKTAATDIYSALGQKLKKKNKCKNCKEHQRSYLLIYFAPKSVATSCNSVLWSKNPI